MMPRTKWCETCDGRGQVHPDPQDLTESRNCPDCQGTGKEGYAQAFAVVIEERASEEDGGKLINSEIIAAYTSYTRAEEFADITNCDGVGSLTSRIRAVVKPARITQVDWEKLHGTENAASVAEIAAYRGEA